MMSIKDLTSSIEVMFKFSEHTVIRKSLKDKEELTILKNEKRAILSIIKSPPGRVFKVTKSIWDRTPIFIVKKNLLEIEDAYDGIVNALNKCLKED